MGRISDDDIRRVRDATDLVGVVSERLQAARMQVLDMYSPIARKAGA